MSIMSLLTSLFWDPDQVPDPVPVLVQLLQNFLLLFFRMFVLFVSELGCEIVFLGTCKEW